MSGDTDLSPHDFGMAVIHRLNQRYGLALDRIALSAALTPDEKLRRMTLSLVEAILEDLPNRPGYDPAEDADGGFDAEAFLADRFGRGDIETEPNVYLSAYNFNLIRDYKGAEVYDYIYRLNKRFEAMANSDSIESLAKEIIGGGLVAVGTPMLIGTVKALRAGDSLRTALGLGIKNITFKAGLVVVAIILVSLLKFLVFDNPKRILGLIANDTDDDLTVYDWRGGVISKLRMVHGKMVNFPEDTVDDKLDSTKVQVRKREWLAGDVNAYTIAMGLFFADKNAGFRGAEGIMVFRGSESGKEVALQFAVPYTKDNGTNIAPYTQFTDLSELFRKLYDARSDRIDITADGRRLTSTVNSKRGGVVGLISTISTLAP